MVLEATMICIDNSEWMRNGDYSPSRFQAQADAVNLICGAKTQLNPENTVGVLTMAGKGVQVLVTPTSDLGKILASMHGLDIGGNMSLSSAVQVAQLALKHRQNKHQRQRIVLFAGSPVNADTKTLESIGKKLKKNNVALDIVDFGEENDGKLQKLEALLTAVNSNDNSHIIHVAPGPGVLSDILISSAIFTGDGEGGSDFAAAAAAAAAAVGGPGAFEFGVDPNLDPELALALRVSMEEERARQEAAAKKEAEDVPHSSQKAGPGETPGAGSDAQMADVTISSSPEHEKGSDSMDDETTLLEQALAMSMAETSEGITGLASREDVAMSEAIGDDQDLAYALCMSMHEGDASASQSHLGTSKVLDNQSFVTSVLSSSIVSIDDVKLPGVDPNDPSVQEVLASLQTIDEEKQKTGLKNKDQEDAS